MENKTIDNKSSKSFENWQNHKNIYISKKLEIDKKTVIINGEKDKRIVVSKYMPISRFSNAVEERTFAFLSPVLWRDPFEMLFFHPQVHVDYKYDFCTVNICCFASNDITNEEGFWNIWSKDSSEPIVRVTYDITKLLKELGKNQGLDFYLGSMNYKSRNEILRENGKNSKASYSIIDDYLNDLCLKRDAYQYEIELRLFVVQKVQQNQKAENITKIGGIDYSSIVADVTLPPMEPLGNSHPSMDMYKCMQDCYNLEAKQKIERLITEGKLKCDVLQSALYCVGIKERSY